MFGGVGTLDLCSAMKEHQLPVDWNQDLLQLVKSWDAQQATEALSLFCLSVVLSKGATVQRLTNSKLNDEI
jgi:hypothetical protein